MRFGEMVVMDVGAANAVAGFPVRVASNPTTAAVEGAGVVLNELDFLSRA